jgi:hypothetical protein
MEVWNAFQIDVNIFKYMFTSTLCVVCTTKYHNDETHVKDLIHAKSCLRQCGIPADPPPPAMLGCRPK